jgi:hypothetical protein
LRNTPLIATVGNRCSAITSQTVRLAVKRRSRMWPTPSWAITCLMVSGGMTWLRASTVKALLNLHSASISRIVKPKRWLL